MAKRKTRKPSSVQDYIIATELEGKNKADAYKEHIDGEISAVSNAVTTFESGDQYLTMLAQLTTTNDAKTRKALSEAKFEHVSLYRKGMKKVAEMLDGAEDIKEAKTALVELERIMAIPVGGGGEEETNVAPHQNYDLDGVVS